MRTTVVVNMMKVTDVNIQQNLSLIQNVYACQSHLNTLVYVITIKNSVIEARNDFNYN